MSDHLLVPCAVRRMLVAALLFANAALLSAQELVWSVEGSDDSGLLGSALAGVGDVDGDGLGDVLVAAPQEHGGGLRRGRALLLSGADGSLIRSFSGEADQDLFGSAIAAAGDLDGDGMEELLIGAPLSDRNGSGSGAAYVYDGATGALRFSVSGELASEQFGGKVTAGEDLSGDGVPDWVVSAEKSDCPSTNCGRVYVYSGTDGALLYTLFGPEEHDSLGLSLGLIKDLDGDGAAELIAGSSRDLSGRVRPGQVSVFSGKTGAMLFEYSGPDEGGDFGFAVSSGDLDGDGIEDLVIGAPHRSKFAGRGHVFAYSGNTRQLLLELAGEKYTELGDSVLVTPDLNGDAHGDIVAGSPAFDDYFHPQPDVSVFSGFNGELLFKVKGSQAESRFGNAIAAAGDLDGDGHSEILVGAPLLDGSAAPYAGGCFAFSGSVAPVVNSVTPDRAFYQTGGPVVIEGRRFLWDLQSTVRFGDLPANNVDIVDDFTIVCDAPPNEPGLLVSVSVSSREGDGVLKDTFRYAPHIQLEGEPKTGEQVLLRLLCEPSDALIVFVGAPPPVSIPTPPFDGLLCIAPFQLLFIVPVWPFSDFSFLVDIPADPSLEGVVVLCQALIGDPIGAAEKDAAWSNCLEITID